MKTPTYILTLLLFVLPLLSKAQNDSIVLNNETPSFKNQIDLDFEILAFSLGYKHRINKNWMIGPGFGIGPAAAFTYLFYKNRDNFYGVGLMELMHVSLITKKNNKNNKLNFEIEPRLSITSINDGRMYYSMGVGLGLFYGGKIRIGNKLSIGKMYNSSSQPIFISNSLILRLPKKW